MKVFFIKIISMTVLSMVAFPVTAERYPTERSFLEKQKIIPENMAFVRGGCFQMGDVFRDVPSSEKPVHEVCLDDFYIGKHEVTVGEFRKFVQETGYRTEAEWQDGCHGWVGNRQEEKKREFNWHNTGFPQTEQHPVVCVTWNDAYHYIQWINTKKRNNYRLPTEAEWEYAARSSGKRYQYSWGNGNPSGNIADEVSGKELTGVTLWKGYRDGYPYTAPVGSFKPNELGIYDMSGNVYEWVFDWQEDGYYGKSPRFNPRGPDTGRYKLLRGGAWDLEPETARTTSRYWNVAGARAVCMGFRLAHPAISPGR
jgi:formylglycine-generating enzyme required for sulfatase activity